MASRAKRGSTKKSRVRRRTGPRVVAPSPPRRQSAPATGEFQSALTDVARFLRSPGVVGAVIGGVAVIARGVPRFTADIDVAVVPPVGGVDDLLRRLSAFGFEPRIDGVQRFAEENLVILTRHGRTDVDIDLSLAQLPFEQEAISEAEWIRFGRTRVPVPRATALVIY